MLSGLISEGHARALAAIDDPSLMVEAYKIILRESGSVRRAEELARRMKAKSKQSTKKLGIRQDSLRVVSEEIDKMQEDMKKALEAVQNNGDVDGLSTDVKLVRSRRETKIFLVFKGGLEETENRLQKVYKSLTSSE